jgi:hypothetical protein
VARALAGADATYWPDAPAAGSYVLLASAGSHRPAASAVMVRERVDGRATVLNVLLADAGGLADTVTAANGGDPRRARS